MAREYVLSDEFDLAAVPDALAPSFVVVVDTGAVAERSFYDTFDGRLHAAGLSLTHEDGRLALLDHSDHERAGTDWSKPPEHLLPAALPPGPLRELLTPLVEARALLAVACVGGRRRVLRVLDDERKTVVRLILEEPLRGGNAALRPRLRAVGVRGYDKTLLRTCRKLEAKLGLTVADCSVRDEAVALAGGVAGGVSSKPDVQLDAHERADRAAARIAQRLLDVIEANLPGTLADVDSEFLHDLRVAVRRTRSLQRELRHAFPPAALAHFRAEFRWLQAVTGPSRDFDVYVLDFDDFRAALPGERRADLDPLRALLVKRRARERTRMVRALRSARTSTLLREWGLFVAGLEQADEADRPDAARPIAVVASGRIAKVYGRMAKAGNAIDGSSAPAALHDLRKQGKELRYLLEFFAVLYPAKVVKPKVRTLKALQDTLGRFQDREVQAELLRSLGDDVRALEHGAPALMAMGQLVERLEEQQADARAQFSERFAAFASKRQRALVRETFT